MDSKLRQLSLGGEGKRKVSYLSHFWLVTVTVRIINMKKKWGNTV